MDLHEFIHSPAVTCAPETAVREVARLMSAQDVGSVIVIDADGAVMGIVTDRDLVIRWLATDRGFETPVGEIMTKGVVSLREDGDIFDAAQQMAMSGCRRLPVVGIDGILKGVIALDDLMVVFARQTDNLATAVATEITKPSS